MVTGSGPSTQNGSFVSDLDRAHLHAQLVGMAGSQHSGRVCGRDAGRSPDHGPAQRRSSHASCRQRLPRRVSLSPAASRARRLPVRAKYPDVNGGWPRFADPGAPPGFRGWSTHPRRWGVLARGVQHVGLPSTGSAHEEKRPPTTLLFPDGHTIGLCDKSRVIRGKRHTNERTSSVNPSGW